MEEENTEVQEQQPQDVNVIEQTNAAAERLEKANAELKATMEQQRAMQMEMKLSGSADAGPAPVKEDTPAEYANKALRGELHYTDE